MKVFARNYRGFESVEIDTAKVNLLVGDNSCGKSSLIYLIDLVLSKDLSDVPRFQEDFTVDDFDYFSPYTNYADVTFGLKSQDSRYAKIITVRRRDGQPPDLIKCTFFHENNFSSFKKAPNGAMRRNGRIATRKTGDLMALHDVETEYKNVNLPDSVTIGNPACIITTTTQKTREKDNILFRGALDNIAIGSRTVSPLRALPEKYYTFTRRMNVHGKHFASMWFDFEGGEQIAEFNEIRKFGEESGLYDSISVRKIAENIEDSPLVVTVKRSGQEFLLNQIGIGVSQVVPVLIDTMYSMHYGNPSLLMQQPELHLHPVAQAALGTYLAKCSFKGLRPVIETHSSYLIDRMRAEVRDFKHDRNEDENMFKAEIIFCEQTNKGNQATHIKILPDGTLDNAPDSYHQFFVEELVRTMF